jgi:hypothetical protein
METGKRWWLKKPNGERVELPWALIPGGAARGWAMGAMGERWGSDGGAMGAKRRWEGVILEIRGGLARGSSRAGARGGRFV